MKALGGTVYNIEGVRVQVGRGEGHDLRSRAFSRAKLKAFTRLLAIMVPGPYQSRLPSYEEKTVDTLLKHFSLQSEHFSRKQYTASLSFYFDPQRVQEFLHDRAIDYNQTIGKKTLVLPIYEYEGRITLWEETPWRIAWNSVHSPLIPLIFPLGDSQDSSFMPSMVSAGLGLDEFKKVYEVEDVLVAHLHVVSISSLDNTIELTVTLRRLSESTPYVFTRKRMLLREIKAYIQGLPQEIILFLSEKWKNDHLVTHHIQKTAMTILLSKREEWPYMIHLLNSIPLITHIDIRTFATNVATVNLTHYGQDAILRSTLKESGLFIESSEQLTVRKGP